MKELSAEIVGLFGYAKGATFHNIELVDVDISSAGSDIENKKVDAICAVPTDCKMTDNRIYPLKDTVNTVEIETSEFKGKTYYLVYTKEQLRAISTGQYGMDKSFIQQQISKCQLTNGYRLAYMTIHIQVATMGTDLK